MPDPARFPHDFEESPPRPVTERPVDPERELPADAGPSLPLGEIPHDQTESEPVRSRATEVVEAVRERVDEFADHARETLRHVPDRLQEMKRRFKVIQGRTTERARTTAVDLRQTAESRARQAKGQFEFYSREYPLETILSIAGVAFALGFLLRVWRSRD